MEQCYTSMKPFNARSRRISHQNRRSITFTTFRGMERFKKAALSFIASRLTKAEVGELENVFKAIDTDNDGIISMHELNDALKSRKYLFY